MINYLRVFFLGFFFFDGSFSTSSCGRNFEDIDMQSFANCRRIIVYFFYMHHMVIFSLFFLNIENLKRKKNYEKMHSTVNIDRIFFWQPVCNVWSFLYKWNNDMRSFLLFSWHRVILCDKGYKMIRSIVIKILPFMPRGCDYAVSSETRECTMFCRTLPLRNCHGILIIILDPYMMYYSKANELLY